MPVSHRSRQNQCKVAHPPRLGKLGALSAIGGQRIRGCQWRLLRWLMSEETRCRTSDRFC